MVGEILCCFSMKLTPRHSPYIVLGCSFVSVCACSETTPEEGFKPLVPGTPFFEVERYMARGGIYPIIPIYTLNSSFHFI